jgi:hypothetical protein
VAAFLATPAGDIVATAIAIAGVSVLFLGGAVAAVYLARGRAWCGKNRATTHCTGGTLAPDFAPEAVRLQAIHVCASDRLSSNGLFAVLRNCVPAFLASIPDTLAQSRNYGEPNCWSLEAH